MKYLFTIFALILIVNDNAFSIKLDSNFAVVGTVRTKYEYNLDSSISAFVVRNARYQVQGSLNPMFDYKAEIDLSDEGRIRMLDAFVNFKPIKNLDITLGQMKVPFSTDNFLRSAHNIAFANRSFISKRVSGDLRDIGGMISYDFKQNVPIKLYLGAFNGYGINRPTRNELKNVAVRIESEILNNLDFSACYYGGEIVDVKVEMFNFGLDWEYKGFVLDGEFAMRKSEVDTTKYDIYSYFVYALKHFPVDNFIFTYITPGVRYDSYDKDLFYNKEITSRLTAGLTFTLTKLNEAHIRMDYENYFFSGLSDQKLDKFTVEFMARF
jgi:hypothetical protein